MKQTKRAAVRNIPSQVSRCAVTPKIIINFGRTLSEHVAQLKFGNNPEKVYLCIYSIVNRRLQSTTIENDLHFFLELVERSKSGAQRLGPHVAREGILCGPQCLLGIFR